MKIIITEKQLSKLIQSPSRNRVILLNEIDIKNKTIINVDIQPEYENYITFRLSNWINFLNQNGDNNQIVFLYNGYESLGMIDESTYKMWLMDMGIDENITYNATFYDKGYAFFRYCMDNSIDEDNIADLVKYMVKHHINDSRDFDEEMWDNYMAETNHDQNDVKQLLHNADDMIYIPDLMDFLTRYRNIVLLGGGMNECLKEVEIALMALDKPYNKISELIY